jgi:hypothetical protein
MVRHTPWVAVKVGEADGGAPIFEVYDSRSRSVAGPLFEDAARLIAAAPDLLAALQEIVREVVEGAVSDSQSLEYIKLRARQALAKVAA